MLPNTNKTTPQQAISIGDIAPQRAIELFESCATSSDKEIFPNGVYDQCTQVFGAMRGARLIGLATVRDANTYYTFIRNKVDRVSRDELLRVLNRVQLYDLEQLKSRDTDVLKKAVIQISWIACGGQKGFKGEPHGVELFARFIDPDERGKGIGAKLLEHAVEQLANAEKGPIRVLPTDRNRTYSGLSQQARNHLVIMNYDWFMERLR